MWGIRKCHTSWEDPRPYANLFQWTVKLYNIIQYQEEQEVDFDPRAVVLCPYDRNHRMSQSRYPYHVIRCRAKHRSTNSPAQFFRVCPFNARLEMPASNYNLHLSTCPARRQWRDEAAACRPSEGGNIRALSPTQLSCWDEEWDKWQNVTNQSIWMSFSLTLMNYSCFLKEK